MPDDERMKQIESRIDKEIAGGLVLSASSGVATIAPRNIGELMEFAKMMAVSGPCVRSAFRGNPGACLALAIQAFRWGADPFAVANKAYITKNNKTGEEQIAYEAQLVHAIINSSSVLQKRLRPTYSGEGASRKCVIVGLVKGEEEPLEYESPEIAKIGVKNSPLWTADPDQQLFYYSSRAWARRHVPEILLGIYTTDENLDAIDLVPDVTPPRPRREDYLSPPSPPPLEETPDPYEIVDHVGEYIQTASVDEACETFRDFLNEAQEARGAEGVVAVWENNAALMTLLEERGHGDRSKELGRLYAGTREAAARPPAETGAQETT